MRPASSEDSVESQLEWLMSGTADVAPQDELGRKLERSRREGRPLRVKLGMDPTAPDLHLGHSLVLRKLRQFQDLGHEAILIIGDFTALIGDPTGRSETRKPLSPADVRRNAVTYQEQAGLILDSSRTRLVFNNDWLGELKFADLIRLTSHYTVARLLERDDFAKRLAQEHAIGVHEFMYAFAQAYDSVHLQADVELGGTDQRFNILMGRSIQSGYGHEPQVAVLMPILVGLDGVQKMSKSLGNTVGLADPPQLQYARLMSISDELMPSYFESLSRREPGEWRELAAREPMEAKKLLAAEIVESYHGGEAAASARAEWERVHSKRELPDEIPEWNLTAELLGDGGAIWICRLLTAAGLVSGTREARRLVEQEAIRHNGAKVLDPDQQMMISDGDVFQVGRRRFIRVRVGS